jgi:hypothetical protein
MRTHIDEHGFISQIILVLSWYQSPLTDQRRDPWPISTPSPLLRQPRRLQCFTASPATYTTNNNLHRPKYESQSQY